MRAIALLHLHSSLKGRGMKAQLRTHVAALLLLAPVAATFVAQPAAAQQRVVVPQIQGMQLNADNGLEPGSQLRLMVEGTPGSRVTVNFGKTDITLTLRETDRGVYRGTYTVRRADRIDPSSVLNVRMARGKVVARHSFTYPPSFQALAMGGPPAPAVVVAAPRIERFVVLPASSIEPGRELRYRVHGLPGANVTLEIPGIARDIAMREVSPGLYEATYTIRERDDLDAFATAVATLRSGERWVSSRIERALVRDRDRDNRAPTISQLTPRQGDIVSPVGTTLVSGEFDDGQGRGVDPRSVRIMLDGRDVTAQAHITPERFSYRSDLAPGRYTAEVTARDHAGNVASRSWSFDVGGSRIGAAPGSLPLHISSPSHGATVDASGNLVIRGATVPWATVRVRVDAVPPVVGQLFGVAQTLYNDTIQADRDGRFTVEVDPRTAILPGMRYDVSVTATRGDQTADTRITLHQRG